MPGSLQQQANCAARRLEGGLLVAIPTETVYGLAADAFNPGAVRRLYEVKGRPHDNPLILHIADALDFFALTRDVPAYAQKLINKFWPGPMTIVAKKHPDVPDWVGGHPDGSYQTIALRMPDSHLTALAIKSMNVWPAAPSANLAGRPSPTKASHVKDDFDEAFFCLGECGRCKNPGGGILVLGGADGPYCESGVESTVIDVTGHAPQILRPGAVTKSQIHTATRLHLTSAAHSETPRSPGQKYKHYAPNADVIVIAASPKRFGTRASALAKYYTQNWRKVGILHMENARAHIRPKKNTLHISVGKNISHYAKNLYSTLRQFDILGVDIILAQAPKNRGLGAAVYNRIVKAAGGRVQNA